VDGRGWLAIEAAIRLALGVGCSPEDPVGSCRPPPFGRPSGIGTDRDRCPSGGQGAVVRLTDWPGEGGGEALMEGMMERMARRMGG